jgi:uncharacterized DUF497 family protein
MSELTFEWSSRKASDNQRKHGVSFEEAKSAFFDENARVIPDPTHSNDEDRFILLGLSVRLRLLVVLGLEHRRVADAERYTAFKTRAVR